MKIIKKIMILGICKKAEVKKTFASKKEWLIHPISHDTLFHSRILLCLSLTNIYYFSLSILSYSFGRRFFNTPFSSCVSPPSLFSFLSFYQIILSSVPSFFSLHLSFFPFLLTAYFSCLPQSIRLIYILNHLWPHLRYR